MKKTTVLEFAEELKMPADALLEQLNKAGVKKSTSEDTLSAADIYLWVATGWGQYVGVDFSAFPKLMAWRARIGERPAVVAALKAEGLIK